MIEEKKRQRMQNYERLNRPEAQAVRELLEKVDAQYVTSDIWGRFATNSEKASALIDSDWLAEHDRAVASAAWDEAIKATFRADPAGWANPYASISVSTSTEKSAP